MAANEKHAPDDRVEEAEIDHEAPAPGPDAPRDAPAIAERATADETAATTARVRFRVAGMPCIEDDEVGPEILAAGERLLAVRKQVALERREPPHEPGSGLPGTLYLTSLRLGLVGRHPVAIPIESISDTAVVGQRLVVGLPDGHYVWIECEGPRLLRVEIAAARALARTPRARDEDLEQHDRRFGTDRRGRLAVPERHGDRG
jgi:hypothetical protein